MPKSSLTILIFQVVHLIILIITINNNDINNNDNSNIFSIKITVQNHTKF